jgi:DNA modification methylase
MIIDPFAGSGNHLIASLIENRRYIGFEISEKYYNDIIMRVNKHTSQKCLLSQFISPDRTQRAS